MSSPGTSAGKRVIPTFTIELPSRGHFYPETSPLSSGIVQLYEVTAKHEDILSNTALLKKGTVLDDFMRAVIATPGVALDDVLVGDKNAILFAARRSAYGDDYTVKVKCPDCDAESKPTMDLGQVVAKQLSFNTPRGLNQFEFTLPASGRKISWRMLTHKDEVAIDNELKNLSKISAGASSPEITTRLKYSIAEVDGKTDRMYVKSFVDMDLSAKDSLALRRHIRENSPDMDMTFAFTCPKCEHSEKMGIPLGANFFWPGVSA